MPSPFRRLLLPVLLALAGLPRLARAQDPRPVSPAPDECWRFAFGAWTPPLDARASGHERDFSRARPSGMVSGRPTTDAPPAARDLAARVPVNGDSTLILCPGWWPAGVELTWDRARSHADTLRGAAHAFVADGRKQNPTAPVIAWRVPCTPPRPTPRPDSAPAPAVPPG